MNTLLSKSLPIALLAAAIAGCNADKPANDAAQPAALVSGIDKANADPSVRAQDDFYRHVNGHWLDTKEIPADKSNYGSFTKLADEAEVQLRAIIEDAAKAGAQAGTEKQKVGDFFNSYMNTDKLETLGTQPLQPLLAEVDAIASKDALMTWFGNASRSGVKTPVVSFINPRISATPPGTRYTPTKAAWGCPTATTTSRTMKKASACAQLIRLTLPRC
ncbi:endothelin-converting enzyme 1 [Simiduia agarivorans]|uniref:Endothelin-converting enzyme 1 n=1 Tax=Simiduia agarivorans (strain DSM 21679 / JCM 13881 / BCRC 17597 / SA1) TaxID=1117647 RepID=R9S502_SIMAS|nr:endothelin-converting enzyme 1 [Simiduia agarivorans]AGN11315.1 endothelin-converting enzyme 1 [Simiduia agarivorans SA1 = DSM 21679]